ncbi:MAG: GNAT family N-acetyltransferase [Burkholderiaceae bacterium]|nr:GNAT family N-acetyltransferase [Burkholderiaceae bacterium]
MIDKVTLADGRSVLVRPMLPQDAALHQQFVRALSPTSRYRRFHGSMRELSADMIEYLTQVDYRSHLALLAETFDSRGDEVQVADVRYVHRKAQGDGADERVADFAIAVADEWQGVGLGSRMLGALKTSARLGGVRRLEGSVLADNGPMRALMRARGWRVRRDPDDAHLLIAWLDLEPLASTPALEGDFAMRLC